MEGVDYNMAKYCSNCGSKLDENADICLGCGILVGANKKENNNSNNNVVNNNKHDFPVWAIIILIVLGCIIFIPLLFIVVIFIFRFTYDNVDDYLEKANNYVDVFFEEHEIISEGTIGDTLRIDDIEFTLNGISKYNSIGDKVCQDGNVYLVFDFDIYNDSDYDNKVVTYMGFSGGVNGEEDDSILPSDIDGFSDLIKKLKPYEKAKIRVVFEVPNNFESFDLSYSNIISFESITFYVINENSNDGNDI